MAQLAPVLGTALAHPQQPPLVVFSCLQKAIRFLLRFVYAQDLYWWPRSLDPSSY
jgi:hypothetical protein